MFPLRVTFWHVSQSRSGRANKSKNPVSKGFDCRFDSSNIKIKDNDFEGSPDYDVFLGTCQNVTLKGNTYSSPSATNNVRLDTGANAPVNVKILDDHVEGAALASGPNFSLGASSDDKICTMFQGNTVDNVPPNGIVSGQLFVPFEASTARASQVVNYSCYQSNPPAAGAWSAGDKVYDESPSASGFVGWVCVIAGSPGTWKTFGAISA